MAPPPGKYDIGKLKGQTRAKASTKTAVKKAIRGASKKRTGNPIAADDRRPATSTKANPFRITRNEYKKAVVAKRRAAASKTARAKKGKPTPRAALKKRTG